MRGEEIEQRGEREFRERGKSEREVERKRKSKRKKGDRLGENNNGGEKERDGLSM